MQLHSVGQHKATLETALQLRDSRCPTALGSLMDLQEGDGESPPIQSQKDGFSGIERDLELMLARLDEHGLAMEAIHVSMALDILKAKRG